MTARNLATSKNASIALHYVVKAQRAKRWVPPITGGVADGRHPREFNRVSLIQGTIHELEHTDRASVAVKIAMDHLAEDPRYYKKLEKIEASRNPKRASQPRPPKGTPTDTNKFALWDYFYGQRKHLAPDGVITRVETTDVPHLKRMVGAGWLVRHPTIKNGWILSAWGKKLLHEYDVERGHLWRRPR